MGVRLRDLLLVLLRAGHRHGYACKVALDAILGGPEVNVGQVYQTLERLERDGLVVRVVPETAGGRRRAPWALTELGWKESEAILTGEDAEGAWRRPGPVVLVLAALSVPGTDVPAVLDQQRWALLHQLRATRRQQRQVAGDAVAQLAAQADVAMVEAMLRWVEECAARLERDRGEGDR